ncbi:TetR/AcrR family transcriptional regulator [Nocardioides sp.]|uniref:TetR/AcrR family transcriptional regulator n=1 Tax=Nocardioides sp. TaxID=35761 RepID=UPI000C97E1DA|nr:TetR/AcrR family transcriptional regulator [Nocardioides sp.]MAS53372.1 TetR family transcriptional regulator [Pimelobacter sp.]MDE0777487.1 TetR/AcrR family transcriptional regulator [Nocardioides sp.]
MVTTEEILAAAQRHLNVDPRASMAVLASAAGVGRATLHRHFASRDALLHELGTRSLDRWEASLDAADPESVEGAADSGDAARITACLQEMFARFLADSDDFGFALTDSYLTSADDLLARSDALVDRETHLYAAAQRAGVLRDDVPTRWLGHAVYGLLVAARDAIRDGDVARRDLDALVMSTFLDGAGPR